MYIQAKILFCLQGYIKRQALYACLTCCTEAKVDPTKRAGVCLACSLTCHENHELIELYTKRNFRCDCGNPKFNSHPCQFTPDKTELNDDNIYNQNFSGLYCTCQRPYPDPDSTIEDDMIQCIICEDWLHASHLEAVVPASDQYSEMICKSCMEKNEFLHDYSMFAVTVEAGDVDIVTVNGDAKTDDTSLCNGDSEEKLVNGIEDNKNETTNDTLNGDVEMDEDKEKSVDNKTIDESATAEKSEETKKDESSTTESSELEPKEKEKSNTDDGNTDLATECKIADQEEKSAEIETEEPAKTDTLAEPEDSNNDKEQKETSEDTSDKSDDKSDAAENKPIADSDQNSDASPEKAENTDVSVPEKTDETKEQTETTEEIGEKESISEEDGDGNKTTSEEKTDTLTEEKSDIFTEEKPAESMTFSDNNKEKDEVETKIEEPTQETANDSEDKPEETATGNIEVPDTSQPEEDANENDAEKADSVMDAIDELLQTANAAKEKEEESKEPSKESTESKEITDNVETKESDVEMSASENKLDNVPDKAEDTSESNDNTSSNADVEMKDTTTENEPASDSKGVSKVNEDKPENVSADAEEKSEMANESISQENIALNDNDDKITITLNETNSELKTRDDNESENKTEPSKDENEVTDVAENTKEHKRKLSTDLTDDISSKKAKLECVRPKQVKRIHMGATFWPSNFRQKLCTCGECISMYKDLKVLFLTDLDDTVFAYESLGKKNVAGGASQYEKGMQALSSLDRIQQINALTEYNRMRDKLLDFLKSFKDRKEIVKEEDIKAFFAGMKPRRESDGVYFCR